MRQRYSCIVLPVVGFYLFYMQEFCAGSLVLLRNSQRDSKKGKKMQQKWLGPYMVISDLGKGQYCIKNPSTECVSKRAVHSARLKQYISPDATNSPLPMLPDPPGRQCQPLKKDTVPAASSTPSVADVFSIQPTAKQLPSV